MKIIKVKKITASSLKTKTKKKERQKTYKERKEKRNGLIEEKRRKLNFYDLWKWKEVSAT